MRVIVGLMGGAALLASAGMALADEALSVAGHQLLVTDDGMGGAVLKVDGAVMHENGVIYLDAEPVVVGGVTVVTGAAGAGGNACNAAPIVLVLPEDAAAELWGPVESCAYFTPQIDGEKLVFASDAVPGAAGETWLWTRDGGFAPGPAMGFAASAGWEAFDSLTGAHPADALKIAPVLEALQAGLGADYAVFAERISDLGSGDLTGKGYLGEACLKFTCEADWAFLYIDRETKGVFAAWSVSDDPEQHLWPADPKLWPEEALTKLGERSAG